MKDFNLFCEDLQLLSEAIVVADGKRTNQILLIMGGSGSGKDFALNNIYWANKNDYKRVSSDRSLERIPSLSDFETNAMKLAQMIKDGIETGNMRKRISKWIKDMVPNIFQDNNDLLTFLNKTLPKEIRASKTAGNKAMISNSDPRNVSFLRLYNSIHGIASNIYSTLLAAQANKKEKPNLAFETTGTFNVIRGYSEDVIASGYRPENINIIWVLTKKELAHLNNDARFQKGQRSVHPDIIEITHSLAKGGVSRLFDLPHARLQEIFDGEFWVVINDVRYSDAKDALSRHKEAYARIKRQGMPFWEGVSPKAIENFSKEILLNH